MVGRPEPPPTAYTACQDPAVSALAAHLAESPRRWSRCGSPAASPAECLGFTTTDQNTIRKNQEVEAALEQSGTDTTPYLVFRAVAGGPANNFFNLNWVEFGGQGISVP